MNLLEFVSNLRPDFSHFKTCRTEIRLLTNEARRELKKNGIVLPMLKDDISEEEINEGSNSLINDAQTDEASLNNCLEFEG